MKIADVKELPPFDRLYYWITERHRIHLDKLKGKPKPWTDDEIIQKYWFTNPYRENDKVTVWFRENVRAPLRNDWRVVFATVAFRWFNLPETCDVLTARQAGCDWDDPLNKLTYWDERQVVARLTEVRARGGQIFTGAYLVNSPKGEPKMEAICRRITSVWQDREKLWTDLTNDGTMEGCVRRLKRYDGMGGFYAYEVACDLRYTHVLESAPDVNTWTNPGPGCVRGLYRLAGKEWTSKGDNSQAPPLPKDFVQQMCALREKLNAKLPSAFPRFEMREVEHSLCEFDKYERLLWGDGRAKRNYNGV